jgi:hypothetical protein
MICLSAVNMVSVVSVRLFIYNPVFKHIFSVFVVVVVLYHSLYQIHFTEQIYY